MMRFLVVIAACAVAAVAACATGGAADQAPKVDAAVSTHLDAHALNGPDAPVGHHDAAVAHDAFVSPDAPGGSGGQFCAINSDCPDSGTCCFVALCVPGTGIGSNICLPN